MLSSSSSGETGNTFARSSATTAPQAGDHRLPVASGRAYVVDRALDIGAHTFEGRRVRLAVDLEVQPRLGDRAVVRFMVVRDRELAHRAVGVAAHVEDRVDHEVHAEVVTFERHRDRVDEERHVVVHDLDERVRRFPAVDRARRCVHPHARTAGGAGVTELPVAQGRARQVLGGSGLEVAERNVRVVLRDERLEVRIRVGRDRTRRAATSSVSAL